MKSYSTNYSILTQSYSIKLESSNLGSYPYSTSQFCINISLFFIQINLSSILTVRNSEFLSWYSLRVRHSEFATHSSSSSSIAGTHTESLTHLQLGSSGYDNTDDTYNSTRPNRQQTQRTQQGGNNIKTYYAVLNHQ